MKSRNSQIHSLGDGGFTLVETLVSLGMFSVAVVARMVALGGGISNTSYVKQKMTAENLAQEGIEYVRNIRDTYVLYDATSPQVGWNSFSSALSNNCGSGCDFNEASINYSNLNFKITSITFTPCSGACPQLLYNTSTGKFNYAAGGANSGFTRMITYTPVGSPVNEIKVTSTVTWTQGSGTYFVTLTENLFNWLE